MSLACQRKYRQIVFLFMIPLLLADEAPQQGCLLQNRFVNDVLEPLNEDTELQPASHPNQSSQSSQLQANKTPSAVLFPNSDGFLDLGIGCCKSRGSGAYLYEGAKSDLDGCKKECLSFGSECKSIEYGWMWTSTSSGWKGHYNCIVLPDNDCARRANAQTQIAPNISILGAGNSSILGAANCPTIQGGGILVRHYIRTEAFANVTPPDARSLSPAANETAVKKGDAISDLLDRIVNSQAGGQDACHSQLLVTKHQLNQLHAIVADLASQVNSTEAQIIMYDQILQATRTEMTELANWRSEELDKCNVARRKAITMYSKLRGELNEMNSIANSSIFMGGGQLHKKLPLIQEVPISQHLMRSIVVNAAGEDVLGGTSVPSALHLTPGHPSTLSVVHASGLDRHVVIAETRMAVRAYKNCIGPDDSQMSLTLLHRGIPKTTDACKAEWDALEKTIRKAYTELSRLAVESEQLAHSTACFDSVTQQHHERNSQFQKAAREKAIQINEKVMELQRLRPRLDAALKVEIQIRTKIRVLDVQCKASGAVVSDLDKVRDAIQELSECPGMSRVKFSVPTWIGTWATFHQDAAAQDDAEQDRLMHLACSKSKAGSRAAEVGEIQAQMIEGAPMSNEAVSPLMGVCPGCAGSEDGTFQSKHARLCWDSGSPLSLAGRSTKCGTGKKAIMCVVDEGHAQ